MILLLQVICLRHWTTQSVDPIVLEVDGGLHQGNLTLNRAPFRLMQLSHCVNTQFHNDIHIRGGEYYLQYIVAGTLLGFCYTRLNL